jgi:hypothetical protein
VGATGPGGVAAEAEPAAMPVPITAEAEATASTEILIRLTFSSEDECCE